MFRPVLLLPDGIENTLTPQQLNTVLAHELCHVRRRDNLTASLHMLIEAAFWFYPVIWWIGVRLVVERERACDEEVLQQGNDGAIYAESILNVCKSYLQLPAPFASGVSGADLKHRIAAILSGSIGRGLHPLKKVFLATSAIAIFAIPVFMGFADSVRLNAQTMPQSATPLRFEVASVKRSGDPILDTRFKRSGGRIHWTTDARYLLEYAYNLQYWRVSGWIPGSDHIYIVDVAFDPKATDDQVRLMFQSLLKDRFKLVSHRATKEVNATALKVAPGGHKLEEARPDGSLPPLPPGVHGTSAADIEGLVVATLPRAGATQVVGWGVTMLQLSERLQTSFQSAILDETGLKGRYYFAFEYSNPDDPIPDAPPLGAALRKLGLELTMHKAAVEILVVDHFDPAPTAN